MTIQGKDLDPKKVCDEVKKRLNKHVEIVPPKKDSKKTEDAQKLVVSGPHTCTYVLRDDIYAHPPQYFSDENPNACAIM